MNTAFLEQLDTQTEQRLILSNMSWQDYLTLDSVLENVPGLRLTYCQGLLEIMILSPRHEREKKTIARLLETYALAKNIDLHGCGSTTYRAQAESSGLEPDECYCVGELKVFPVFEVSSKIGAGHGRFPISRLKWL